MGWWQLRWYLRWHCLHFNNCLMSIPLQTAQEVFCISIRSKHLMCSGTVIYPGASDCFANLLLLRWLLSLNGTALLWRGFSVSFWEDLYVNWSCYNLILKNTNLITCDRLPAVKIAFIYRWQLICQKIFFKFLIYWKNKTWSGTAAE